jgi:kinesin family member 5
MGAKTVVMGHKQKPPMTESVKVHVRFRPLLEREAELGLWSTTPFTIHGSDHDYTFDGVMPTETSQSDVFHKIGEPMVHQVLEGFNACLLAYGQTGSGKTYSMMGDLSDPESYGLIPRMMQCLFDSRSDDADMEHRVEMSFVEIYQEKIRDLLTEDLKPVKLREKNDPPEVYLEGCLCSLVTSMRDVFTLLHNGNNHRAVASTQMNDRSSRSHAVLLVRHIKTNKRLQHRKISKLFLVDLAGSEQVNRSGATGQTLDEAKRINKSLSCLAYVIRALSTDREHVPYRDSKLTRLLTDALGGNSKTVLFLACSSAQDSVRETQSTLLFGQSAKMIKNTPKKNEEISLRGYQLMLQNAQDLLQASFTVSMDAMLVVDEQGKITKANEAAVSLFGYAQDELNGMLATKLFESDVGTKKDGTSFPVHVSTGVCQNQTICSIHDLTSIKRDDPLEHSMREKLSGFIIQAETYRLEVVSLKQQIAELKDQDGEMDVLQRRLTMAYDQIRRLDGQIKMLSSQLRDSQVLKEALSHMESKYTDLLQDLHDHHSVEMSMQRKTVEDLRHQLHALHQQWSFEFPDLLILQLDEVFEIHKEIL